MLSNGEKTSPQVKSSTHKHKKSKKSHKEIRKKNHTKTGRKAKRKPQIEQLIPQVRSQKKLGLLVLGKGDNHRS